MKRNGFTLIELLIVLAIIAIVAAIVVPFFTGGSHPIGARDFSSSRGTVVERADGLVCNGGFLTKSDGSVITQNGTAVKC